MKKVLPLIFSATSAFAAHNCTPASPAPCNADMCDCTYCLGPVKEHGNMPVRPHTCNGDFVVSGCAPYWNAHPDGMEYASGSIALWKKHKRNFVLQKLVAVQLSLKSKF
ncbi:MAG: hypothetical protein KR126chlam3_01088 [Chlamydiae bacterium]|nr:hypothetical protein [Chlamydiota bacterium]